MYGQLLHLWWGKAKERELLREGKGGKGKEEGKERTRSKKIMEKKRERTTQ